MRAAAACLGALLLLAAGAQGADYAVIAASSNGYGNYRHQADVCHAYQLLVSGGVPKENIITLMYDDIANNAENPFPGKIFNKPTAAGTPGRDVYGGVVIDYKGADVSAKNFLSVITGDAAAMKGKGSGKVLKSGAGDRVFLNIVDHGAPGLVAFPSDMLYKEDLQNALSTMQSKKMFEQLTFYLEACESGSMFEGLPANLTGLYATTASNAEESSWGTYCGDQAMVDGKNINSCLGDLYSVNWMENADGSDLTKETLQQQYTIVQKETTQSHVMQYGDLKVAALPASDFEGKGDAKVGGAWVGARESVPSRDARLATLYHRYVSAADATRPAAAAALRAEIAAREAADARFAAIVARAAAGRSVTRGAAMVHRACHKAADAAVAQHCGGYSDYSLRHVRTMIDLCEALNGDAATVTAAVQAVCA